jgi:O-antigen ligase
MVDLLLVAWVAWSAVTALLATNHWLALRGWAISFSGAVVYAAARAAAREGGGLLLLRALSVAGTVTALTGLAQAYGLDWDLLAGERAPGGTMGNRNFLAHLGVIVVPVTIVAWQAGGRAARVGGSLALALVTAAVVLTRSRAAWLALAAVLATAGLAWLWARRRQGTIAWRPVPIALALAIGTALALLLPNRLSWRSDNPYGESLRGIVNYQEGSGRGRLIQYRNSLGMVARDPVFGTGPGNWAVHYPRVTTPGDPSYAGADPIPTNPWPSSDWVAFLAERGAIGVLLLLGLGLAAALTAVRRLGEPGQEGAAIGVLAVLAAASVTGLFDAVLLSAAPTLFVFAALGALLPATGAVLARDPPRAQLRWLKTGLVIAGLLGVAQSAAGVTALGIVGRSRERAVLARAVRWDPGNHRLHLTLAMRGSCRQRLPHARAAARLLPYHEWPRRALRACGG